MVSDKELVIELECIRFNVFSINEDISSSAKAQNSLGIRFSLQKKLLTNNLLGINQMAFLPTNASQVQQFAVALYGIKVGTATMAAVQADITAVGGLNKALNGYYTTSFGTSTTATVAASVATNLGLTGAAATDAAAYIAAVLNGTAASARGEAIQGVLNLFSTLTSNATFGAAATAWVAKVENAISYTGAGDATVAAGAEFTGTAFTLGTGVDNSPGTAGNDTYSGLLGTGATLNSFDILTAGAGTDTLNIVDTTAAAFSVLPASTTVSGFETVSLSRNAAAAATSIGVTVVDTTFGTGVKTLNVLEAGLAQTAAAASVTLNSAESVSVISTGVTKFNGVTIADTGATAATAGSTLKSVTIQGGSTTANAVWGNGVTTVNLNDTGAVATVVNAAAGTRAVTVNTSGIAAIGGFTDANATTLNINNTATNGATAVALGTFTAAKATTVNYSSTAANASGTLTAALATTLNVSGTKLATLTLAGNTVLATVNVTGSAGLTTDLTAGATAATLLDTSGTTGTSTVTVNNGTAVTGGAGNDFITVGATTKAINLGGGTAVAAVAGTSIAVAAANTVTLTAGTTALGTGGSINGGSGAADELILVNADAETLSASNAVTTAFKAAVTGFEILNIGTQSATTVNVSRMGTFNTVKMTTAANAQVLAGVTSGQTIEAVFGAAGGTSITTNSLTAGTDTLNLKLSGDLSGGARAFGILATPGAETVNIVTNDTNVTFTTRQATATLNDTNATSIVVTGNNGLTLAHNLADGTTASTNLYNLDASGLTKGAIAYTSGVLTTDATVKGSLLGGDTLNFAASVAAVNMTATAGTNILTGSTTIANTITGGSGADTISTGSGIDTIVGGAGADVIYADNAGTKEVQTIVLSTAALAGNDTYVVAGTTLTLATALNATAATQTDALIAAVNANARLKHIVTAAVGGTTATTLLTYKQDGDISTATFTAGGGAGTTAAVAAGGAGAAITGTTGTTANNVLTGGSGSDIFVFGTASTTASATVFQTINDFATASDTIVFAAAPLTIMASATAAATGTALISAAGVATFAAADATLASRITATEAGINLGGAAAVGQVALFQFGADAYVFISNGTDGVGAGDQLIKLVGVDSTSTAFDAITLASGNMTLA
jgi:S-layer protein